MIANVIWNPLVRVVLFWIIVAGVLWGLSETWSVFNPTLIREVVTQALASHEVDRLSTEEFAFALAAGIAALAAALALAFGLLHVAAVSASLFVARRRLAAANDMVEFSNAYQSIYQALKQDQLIGHAWKEFDETLVMPADAGQPIQNTVRPQAFINIGVLRERLFGLKMMGSIPGYFVGIGLLLTFIGLVLALNKAAAAVNSPNASEMTSATKQLLQVATFKFSTSIAGLGASIALALLFRIYTILIEGSLVKFCHAAERGLRYTAPQSITAEMNERLAEQVAELKQINSAEFFSRMGEQLAPQIETAMSTAIAPMNSSISDAVDRLSATSQTGVSDLIDQFTTSIKGGAGTELRELTGTLEALRTSLTSVHQNIHGTGEDFGRRMSEAAENLSRLVAEAGERMGDSSEKSRATLVEIVDTLRETFNQANGKVQDALTQATGTAASQMEEMLGPVFGRLEAQVSTFQAGLAGFQETMGLQLEESGRQVANSRSAAVEAIGSASAGAAKALHDGLEKALRSINAEFERFSTTMRSTEMSLAAQANALSETTNQSRAVADAFSKTAEDVRAASTPLLQSGERIAGATERLAGSVKSSVEALAASQTSSQQLADALQGHATQISTVWASYSERFANVDKDLARAFENLHDATIRQSELLVEYATKVDLGFASAVQKLNPLLSGLHEDTEDLGGSVDRLAKILMPQAAE